MQYCRPSCCKAGLASLLLHSCREPSASAPAVKPPAGAHGGAARLGSHLPGGAGEGGADDCKVPPAWAGGHPAGGQGVERSVWQSSLCDMPCPGLCSSVSAVGTPVALSAGGQRRMCFLTSSVLPSNLAPAAFIIRHWRRHATPPSCACCASSPRHVLSCPCLLVCPRCPVSHSLHRAHEKH